MNVTGLFAGVGGIELGLHRHGHETTLFCENDPEAATVLANRFPGIQIHSDVRKTEELAERIDPRSDLLTAGFPCTDLSQAGQMRGFDGQNSSLIRNVFDLLDVRPFPHVLIENVPNWRVLHGGRYMAEVLDALEARGYRWAYRVIDARAFGLPQRRLRIFLHASLIDDPRRALLVGDERPDERKFALDEAAHGFYWTEGNTGLGWGENCVPTLKGGSSIGIPAPPAVLMPDGSLVTPHQRDAERLQGFKPGWTDFQEVLPEFGSRAFNHRKRWKMIGNAVNVEVATWIGKNLSESSKRRIPDGIALEAGEKLPPAAWFDGTSRRRVEVGAWPVKRAAKPLHEFMKYPGTPLSLRATAGFFSRISRSSLRIPTEFKVAVEKHLAQVEASVGMRHATLGHIAAAE